MATRNLFMNADGSYAPGYGPTGYIGPATAAPSARTAAVPSSPAVKKPSAPAPSGMTPAQMKDPTLGPKLDVHENSSAIPWGPIALGVGALGLGIFVYRKKYKK